MLKEFLLDRQPKKRNNIIGQIVDETPYKVEIARSILKENKINIKIKDIDNKLFAFETPQGTKQIGYNYIIFRPQSTIKYIKRKLKPEDSILKSMTENTQRRS